MSRSRKRKHQKFSINLVKKEDKRINENYKEYKKMNKVKKIGIVGNWTGANSFGITKPYMFFWSHFGEVSIISPMEKHVRDLDLLVIPGGPDVDVFRYLREEDDIDLNTGTPCYQRERFDKMLLPKYIAKGTPVFGTCRGLQTIAVTLGARLKQHMHHETNGDNRHALVHGITFDNIEVVPGLEELVNHPDSKDYKVNSLHHQTVLEETLPQEATVIARHFKDNEVEAITYWPTYPIHTMQSHSEEMFDEFSLVLISHLLSLSDEEEI